MSFSRPTGQSDAEVIRRSVAEPEVFGEIFSRYQDEVFRFVARRSGVDRAADTTSEVFMTAFRIRERFNLDAASCRPWLYGIATNVIGDAIRKQKRVTRVYITVSLLSEATLEHDVSTDDRVVAQQLGSVLNGALRSLKKRDRETLLLKALDDLSYQEIAEALSIPVGTVRSRLNRARKQVLKSVPQSVWDLSQTNAEEKSRGGSEHE